jgi:antitoxin component of MazEF toxin-antitoxin module
MLFSGESELGQGSATMPTVVKVRKWGHGFGIRIPKYFAEQRSIKEGSLVEIDHVKIVKVKTRRRSRYKLTDLLKGYVKPPSQFDFPPVGKELKVP